MVKRLVNRARKEGHHGLLTISAFLTNLTSGGVKNSCTGLASAVINWSSCSIWSLSLIESALGWSLQESRTVFKIVLRESTRVPQCFDTGEVQFFGQVVDPLYW